MRNYGRSSVAWTSVRVCNGSQWVKLIKADVGLVTCLVVRNYLWAIKIVNTIEIFNGFNRGF